MPLFQTTAIPRWLIAEPGGPVSTSQTFTIGRVLLAQVFVPVACQVDGVYYTVGSVSNGNVIGGLVGPIARTADSPDAAAVLAQSASTAMGTAATAQLLTWTAVSVAPGIYYAALECDSATGTYQRFPNVPQATGLGATYDRAGGYGALTSPTPTTAASSITPGLRLRVV